jgi:hypothetical protein
MREVRKLLRSEIETFLRERKGRNQVRSIQWKTLGGGRAMVRSARNQKGESGEVALMETGIALKGEAFNLINGQWKPAGNGFRTVNFDRLIKITVNDSLELVPVD